MKIAITSDIHIHNFQQFSKIENGANSRLLDICRIVKKILKTAEDNDCKYLLITGDIFHSKKIDVEALHYAADAFDSSDIPIIAISGNHDSTDERGAISSISPFKGRFRIFDADREVFGGISIGGISFKRDPQELKQTIKRMKKCDILMIHAGISGTLMGADFIENDSPFGVAEMAKNSNLLTIAGHYHFGQLFNDAEIHLAGDVDSVKLGVESVLIPGSPLQHNFGDEGQTRGMWILDTDSRDIKFIDLEAKPFITLKQGDKFPANAYARFMASEETSKDTLDELKEKGIAISYAPKETVAKENRLQAVDENDIVEKYVESQKSPASKADLIAAGKEILTKAKNEA